MTRRTLRTRILLALAVLCAPAAIVLAGLALLGEIRWGAAVLGLVGVAVLSGLVMFRHAGELSRLRRVIEGFRAEPPALAVEAGLSKPTLLCPGLAEALAETAHERSQVRGELSERAARTEAVLEALPDPLIMLAEDARILRANPAAQEVFEGPLAGRDLPSVLRNPDLLTAVDEVLHGASGRLVEFTLPGEITRHVSARVARLAGPARDGTVAIVSLHDLTALKRAEQMRADFVANASHELRTPLASLLGYVETLQGPARDDAAARDRFLAIMREQGARMSRLIEDLLSLSQIELHEHSRPRGTVDLGALLRSVANTLQPQVHDKDMRLDLDMGEVPEVVGAPDELTQVFQNLIDNAVKYGRAGTPIRIESRAVDAGTPGARRLGRPGVAVSVTDRGDGIAREHIPRLTERFYRVDTARSRELGGTGLGLAIVKHILNRHRGVLDIASTPGRGSTFTVYLPAAAETHAGPPEGGRTLS